MASKIGQWLKSKRIGAKLRRAAQLLAIVCFFVLLVIAYFLGTTSGRQTLLDTFLPLVQEKLPGHLTLSDAHWPSLGSLELQDVLWRSTSGDTLLAAAEFKVELSLRDLVRKDVQIDRLWAAELVADLPALQSQFATAPSPADQSPAEGDSPWNEGTSSFPRPGAVPGLPSMGVGQLTVTGAELRLDTEQRIQVEELTAAVELRHGRTPWLSASLRMRPRPELIFATRFKASLDDSLRVDLAPLQLALADGDGFADPSAAPLTGRVTLSWEELLAGAGLPAATVTELRVTGVFGEMRLDGDLVRGGGGAIHIWARRPPSRTKFLQALASVAPEESDSVSLADSLWSLWPASDGPDVDMLCEMTPAGADDPWRPGRVAVSGVFTLPGPRDLKPLLPPELKVDDLDYLRGHLEAEAQLAETPISFQGTLDLGATTWLDTAIVSLRGTPEHITLDSLNLVLPGAALAMSGTLDREQMDLVLRVDIPDSSLLTRWESEAVGDVSARLSLRARVRGPLTAPDLEADIQAAGRYGHYSLPAFTGSVRIGTGSAEITLTAPEGVTVDTHTLTALQAFWTGSLPDSAGRLSGRFHVDARGDEFSLVTAGSLDLGDAFTLLVDSLATSWQDQRLTTRQPFTLTQDPDKSLWQVSGLDITGDPGHIWGEGTMRPDSIDVHLGLDLQLVHKSLQQILPAVLPGLTADDTLVVTGDLRLLGSGADPAGHLSLRTAVQGIDPLSDLALEVSAWLLPLQEDGSTPHLSSGGAGELSSAPENAPWPGIAADLRITHQDSLLLAGQVRYPGRFSLDPVGWTAAATDSVVLELRSRTIRLAELQPYLPAGIALEGECNLAAAVRGVGEELRVTGHFEAPGMTARLEDGSWLTADSRVDLGGTVQEPAVEGKITITGGLIRLPEVPPQLLPTEGEAILWQLAAADSLPTPDSHEAATAKDDDATATALQKSSQPSQKQPIKPQLAVKLDCPGTLRVTGHGLDVLLAGDLDVGLQGGLPAAAGQLEAVHGTFRLLGRVFEIEKGEVTFYGDEVSLNPELDLSLTTYVSGTLFRVQILGNAEEPELVLTSEPYMSESDIISMLLFGQQLYQLDGGQEDLLQTRTNEILASYGAAQLQDQVGSQMGIDVITYGQGTDKDSTAGSLTVGKYLSPKVLMKYEKVLEKHSAYYVHLNYTIDRNFKLETTYGQSGNSGIAVKWGKDY